jgi:hypothetical protein
VVAPCDHRSTLTSVLTDFGSSMTTAAIEILR